MARTAKTAVELPELPPDFPDMVDSESLATLREALSIVDEADTTVHVYRIDAESKIDAKIWDGDADAFNLGALAKVFGSGQYRIKIYARNPDGYKPLRYNRIQSWELSPEDEAHVKAAKYAANHPELNINTSAPHNGTDVKELVSGMMAGFQATVAQMMAAMKPAQTADPFAMMQQMAGILKTLAPAPVAQADATAQLSTMLSMMKNIKDIAGDGASDGMSASDRLLMKAADSFMPALASGLQKQAQQGVTGPQPDPAQSAVAALPAPGAQPETEINEETEMLKIQQQAKMAMFTLMLQAANKAAARGVPAAEYADKIYDDFDEGDVATLALAPNWFAMLCEAHAGCKAHEAWYNAVRAEIIDIAIEDGVLVRDAAGALTAAPDSDTVAASTGGTDGTIDDAGGTAGTGAK